MSTASQALGEVGERIAERWLTRAGWRILNRRFRNGHRYIDLVAERNGTVAFFEVKSRRDVDPDERSLPPYQARVRKDSACPQARWAAERERSDAWTMLK